MTFTGPEKDTNTGTHKGTNWGPALSERKPEYRRAAATGPLDSLPIFYTLTGKTVLLIAETEDAIWKADLLHAAGAHIRLVIPHNTDLIQYFSDQDPNFELHIRDWTPDDLQDVTLAFGALASQARARDFADSCRKHGVPVNTVDRPDSCDFQMGSIINRAPVIVSVSTGGTAPTLGQTVRQKLETLLPQDLGLWARQAGRIRRTLARTLPGKAQRLEFWRRYARDALSKPFTKLSDIRDMSTPTTAPAGRVTLVGAGPGDPDLLTVKALRALQAADIILFDDLISDAVLQLSRREAKRFTVGKRGGRASCKQDDIHQMMLQFARAGKHVVRLKSGDPMVFGRGGEEIAALEAAGIPVHIVPGITTAIAAAAATRTSLTHRDHAQGVKLITAHSRKGQLPDLDWDACAAGDTSLMVYMGAGTCAALAQKLLDAGMDADCPVMVATAVSRRDEDYRYMSLLDLSAAALPRDNPVLIGIGTVFAAAQARQQQQQQQQGQTVQHLAHAVY